MTTRNGVVRSVSKIVDNGSERNRWDLVVLGDGYRAEELAKYERDVLATVDAIFETAPFDRLRAAINVHRVNVESTDSGAGDLCAGISRATFFTSNYCGRKIPHLLVADTTVALETALDEVPTMNATLLLVNSDRYGGSGGAVPVCSVASAAFNVALHEMGHSHFGLADEYSDPLAPGQDVFRGDEPPYPNVTARLAALKWRTQASPGIEIPTTNNSNCSSVDDRPSHVPLTSVGAFEGAFYHHCGVYRPQYDCKMRNVEADFCAVCTAVIDMVLRPFLPKKQRSVRK